MRTLILLTSFLILSSTASSMPIFMDYGGLRSFKMEKLSKASEDVLDQTFDFYIASWGVEGCLTKLLLEQPEGKDFVVTDSHLRIYTELWKRSNDESITRMLFNYIRDNNKYSHTDERSPTHWTDDYTKKQISLAMDRAELVHREITRKGKCEFRLIQKMMTSR